MSVIYQAYDLLFERAAVMEVLNDADIGSETRTHAARAQSAARLNYTNISKVYDVFEADRGPFIEKITIALGMFILDRLSKQGLD